MITKPSYHTPIPIIEYKEHNCPYCRYVYYEILKRLEDERPAINKRLIQRGQQPIPPIQVKTIDIDANRGCKEQQWFEIYSKKVGGTFTPAVYLPTAGKILYLFGSEKKPLFLEEKWTRKADQMLIQLIKILQQQYNTIYRPITIQDIAPKPPYIYTKKHIEMEMI